MCIDSDGDHPFDWNAYQTAEMLSFRCKASKCFSPWYPCHDVDRIIEAAKDDVDWFILLEDDVWVRNCIHAAALVHDINGQCLTRYNVDV